MVMSLEPGVAGSTEVLEGGVGVGAGKGTGTGGGGGNTINWHEGVCAGALMVTLNSVPASSDEVIEKPVILVSKRRPATGSKAHNL